MKYLDQYCVWSLCFLNNKAPFAYANGALSLLLLLNTLWKYTQLGIRSANLVDSYNICSSTHIRNTWVRMPAVHNFTGCLYHSFFQAAVYQVGFRGAMLNEHLFSCTYI